MHVSDSGLCDTATPKSPAGQVKARGEDAFAWRCKIEMCETGCKINRFERSPLCVRAWDRSGWFLICLPEEGVDLVQVCSLDAQHGVGGTETGS